MLDSFEVPFIIWKENVVHNAFPSTPVHFHFKILNSLKLYSKLILKRITKSYSNHEWDNLIYKPIIGMYHHIDT